eukprot:1016906-Pelagomonas_calceolata.AAC.5
MSSLMTLGMMGKGATYLRWRSGCAQRVQSPECVARCALHSLAQTCLQVFNRMGFNDQEIVVLSGAHTLGRVKKDRSGLGEFITACPPPGSDECWRPHARLCEGGLLLPG